MTTHQNFTRASVDLKRRFLANAKKVTRGSWQGLDVSMKPEMVTFELMNVHLDIDLRGIEDIGYWQQDIKPNLPWAEDHFHERVSGEPINPGVEWANWPWGKSAERFLEGGIFDHNYMERYWPKYAGAMTTPTKVPDDFRHPETGHHITELDPEGITPIQGIRFPYGDLNDIVRLLVEDRHTRQAYLPLYFPEDTGRKGRKPCSLGYQFILEGDRLNVFYPMRSCDYLRHYADDMYLTVRLLLWVIDRCRELDDWWNKISPGRFTCHIVNLHIFANDVRELVLNET